ncbi:MAG: reverse transcriptase, partial [Proteobacteria bacterium]|nr:reverse transcriptase [Pseudomonadota bacterium]
LSEEAKPKSAFITSVDKYQFNRCPFGLTQAPAYFQRLVNKVLVGLPFTFGYLDDVLIYSPDIKTHLEHLEKVFQRLREADLRLKWEKCNFLKAHLQYLGHIISGSGIEPVPEKLESIKKMPAPTTPKEVKQFLGLVGYYRKFIPRFADIARPLTSLTKKNIEYKWTDKCEASFQLLKEALMKEPILRYPDPEIPYILYTDASKYAWACVLTQPYVMKTGEKAYKNHPITYVSGLFKGSQINWATLTKEAYAIYMSVKKLNYYLEDADIILMSDHLPLKKFLKRNTLNAKVNNWAVELSSHRIEFKYIKGIKNTLADTMSRLVQIDPDIQLSEEEEGKEYGYAIFESLPPLLTKDEINSLLQGKVSYEELHSLDTNKKNPDKEDPIFLPDEEIKLPLSDNKLIQLQKRDKFCKNLLNQLESGKLSPRDPYYIEDNILKRCIDDKKQRFE